MIQVTSRKYYSQWGNAMDFSTNLSGGGVDLATHLKGSVGEKIKFITRVKAALISVATQADPFETINGNILRRASGSWIDEGFAIGQSCAFIRDYTGLQSGNAASVEWTDTIVALSHSEILFTSAIFPVSAPGPGQKTDHALVCMSKFGALIYQYGLVENNAAENFLSPYTNDVQQYYKDAIDVSTAPGAVATMTVAGGTSASKSWMSGDVTVQYIASTNPLGLASPTYNYVHEYEITQIFVISPVFIENYLSALEAGTQPDDFIGTLSPKHISNYEFRSVLSNPNTTVKFTDESQVGSVGWFDENYNGFNDIYSVAITDYRDTIADTVVDGLQLKRKTKVTGVITGSGFTNTSKAGAYFFWAAPLAKYSAKQDSFQDTFLWDNKILTMVAGTVTDTGTGRIKRLLLTYVNGTTINFELDIEFSADEIDFINPSLLDTVTDKYFIGIQVGNTSTVDTSNKVIMKLDWAQFVVNNDVENLATFKDQQFFDHGMEVLEGGHTDLKAWKQDGISFSSTIVLNKALNANLKAVTARLIAYKTATSAEFELQKYSFNLADVVDVNGTPIYQQLNLATTRGFKLESGDQFNDVLLSFDVVASNLQEVNILLGMKLDWQSWVKLPGADTIFYNAALDSLGTGKDASRYSMNQGYEIRLVLDCDVRQLTDVATRYRDMSPNLDIYGWGLDADDPANWSALIQTFDEAGNNLSGAILQNADTKMKITWTPQSGSTTGFNNPWAIHRIEPVLANGYNDIDELSSFRGSRTNNLLKPLAGETFLKVTVNAGTIVTECLIDYTKLNGGEYNISGRLGRDITYPRYNAVKDLKFLFEDQSEMILLNIPSNGLAITNSLRHAILNAEGFIETENAITLDNEDYFAPRLIVDYAHLTNGKPNFYMVCYTGFATEVYEFIYDGATWQQAKIYSNNNGGSGPTTIRIDPALSPNGKPFIWFGNSSANLGGGDAGFVGLYHDGAVWQDLNIIVYDAGAPANSHFQYPLDVQFHDGKIYLMNGDNPNPPDDWERGKIGVFEMTSGDPTDPVDRANWFTNYTLTYNLYKHTTASVSTDGIGTVGDLAYSVGMEILETDANGNPVFLIVCDASVAGARHFARLYANIAVPTGPAHWTIQTPMAATNDSFGPPLALRGRASATYESSPLEKKNECHIAIVNGNTWITGNYNRYFWTKHIISDWTGANNNEWYVWNPNDPTFTFNSGNTLHE